MADKVDQSVTGKSIIESKLVPEDNDEFMSQVEDKKQKKSFMNKLLRDIDETKEEDNNKPSSEQVVVAKNAGFASRFNEEDGNDDVWVSKSIIKVNPLMG